MKLRSCALAAVGLLAMSSAEGASLVFNISANGLKEVSANGTPGQGDPDGLALGTLRLDSGTTGNTAFAEIRLELSNIDFPLGGFHIHEAPATANGPIRLDFGNAESFRNGNQLIADIPNLSSTQINTILTNSENFYFNLHNGPFGGGAVRDQLTNPIPEPSSLLLAGVAGLTLVRRKRR